jgi:hypothetical protein
MAATAHYVKIHVSRGYRTGLYEVVSETSQEYKLRAKGEKDVFSLYKAYTYQDAECGRTMHAARQAVVNKILERTK